MIPEELVADLQTLKNSGHIYELIEEGPRVYVRFTGHPLPLDVYNMPNTDLLVFTTQQYPNANFDMFWVDEGLRLKNQGVPRNATEVETHLGRRWRRFSYHPYQNNPWNPAVDSVISFMSYVDQRLAKGD